MTDNQQKVSCTPNGHNLDIMHLGACTDCGGNKLVPADRPVAALSAPAGEREDREYVNRNIRAIVKKVIAKYPTVQVLDVNNLVTAIAFDSAIAYHDLYEILNKPSQATTPPTGKAAGVETISIPEDFADAFNRMFSLLSRMQNGVEVGPSQIVKAVSIAKRINAKYADNDSPKLMQSAQPSETGEGKFAEWVSARDDIYYDSDLKLWVDKYTNHITTSSLMAEYQQYLLNNK